MGYNTYFTGDLKFTHTITAPEVFLLQDMFEANLVEHPEWHSDQIKNRIGYIDYRFNETKDGIEWNDESEKSEYMTEICNLIIYNLKKINSEFGLKGEMLAQGEDIGDTWKLVCDENGAREVKIEVFGIIECPECHHQFKQGDS